MKITAQQSRWLALLVTTLILLSIWIGLIVPLWGYYQNQRDRLTHDWMVAAHMQLMHDRLPQLQARAKATGTNSHLIAGSTDSLAAAALQQSVQALAAAAGASFSSVETIPPVIDGASRAVGLRLALVAPWPVLIHLLTAIDRAPIEMAVTDIDLNGGAVMAKSAPLTISLTIRAKRSETAP